MTTKYKIMKFNKNNLFCCGKWKMRKFLRKHNCVDTIEEIFLDIIDQRWKEMMRILLQI